MIKAIVRLLPKTAGLLFEVRNPIGTCRVDPDSALSTRRLRADIGVNKSTHWRFSRTSLRSGWYMLEIEHSKATIGCVLTLETGANCKAHLRLTSKPVCKRIVRLDMTLTDVAVSIDQNDSVLDRLTLTRVTHRFATSRMNKRLANQRINVDACPPSAAALYQQYQAHIHTAIFPESYAPYASGNLTDFGVLENTATNACDLQLVLVGLARNRKAFDTSVELALAFARRVGWKIDWHLGSTPAFCSHDRFAGKRVFHMPVSTGVVYKVDVFHKMMGAIEQETVLLYADHDDLDDDGVYLRPQLKPSWNPELLLNQNYIDLPWLVSEQWVRQLHFLPASENDTLSHRVLLAAALGFTGHKVPHSTGSISCSEHEYVQDHIPALEDSQVKRVPEVLASVQLSPLINETVAQSNKATWADSVSLALADAKCRATVVTPLPARIVRVKWHLPLQLPTVDIIIPTRNMLEVLKSCIGSILGKTEYTKYRIVVVDNDSDDSSIEPYYSTLVSQGRVKILRYGGMFNYSALNNYAVGQSDAEIVVLLNNDTEVISPNWLCELVSHCLRPTIGCVGAKLYYSNGRIQHGGVVVGIMGVAGHAHRYMQRDDYGYCYRLVSSQNYSAITAACLAVKREIFLKVGGLDQEQLAVAWNDIDFCLKVRQAGYRNLWTPHAQLFHHEGLSRGADDTAAQIDRNKAERNLMLDRWKLDQFVDPAYHPLLTRDNEAFTLGELLT